MNALFEIEMKMVHQNPKVAAWVLTACLVGCWLSSTNAAATIYYVAQTRSDEANGRTIGAPFRSIQKAASVAAPGDTVYIRAGTYRETHDRFG